MHSPSTVGSHDPALVVNVEKLNELRRANGIKTERELARHIGVDEATLFRVTSGRTTPSNQFIARLSRAFPLVSLDHLLIVRDASDSEAASA